MTNVDVWLQADTVLMPQTQGLSLSARVESVSRIFLMSRWVDLEGKKVDLPDMNSKRDKEREEEERVFIVSTKGRYGPEKKP